MAVSTVNQKLASMGMGVLFPNTNLPVTPSTFGTDDKQQLVWAYPFESGDAGSGSGDEEDAVVTYPRWRR